MIVASLLEEQPTVELVTATKESIEQMTQEPATLMASYTKIKIDIWNIVKSSKVDEGGLGTSH